MSAIVPTHDLALQDEMTRGMMRTPIQAVISAGAGNSIEVPAVKKRDGSVPTQSEVLQRAKAALQTAGKAELAGITQIKAVRDVDGVRVWFSNG